MGLFGKKELSEYKIMDKINLNRTNLNIDEALREKIVSTHDSIDKCRFVFEDDAFQYYLYYPHFASGYFLLRRDKNNHKKIVFLGKAENLACYFHEKIFTVSSYSMFVHDRHITIVDCKTGERRQVDCFGQGTIWGGGSAFSQDRVQNMIADNNAITMTIRREKAEYDVKPGDPYNDDFIYEMKILYQKGQFAATPLTPNMILERGPWPKPSTSKKTSLDPHLALLDLAPDGN